MAYSGGGVAGAGGSQNSILFVNNYSDLPSPSLSLNGVLYGVYNSQGTWWLPGSLGGTYYSKGFYVCDGTTWTFLGEVPVQATSSETINEIIDYKFVSPSTLGSWWQNKPVQISKIQNLQQELDSKLDVGAVLSFSADIDKIELELLLNPDTIIRFKEFFYDVVSGNVTEEKIWSNSSKILLLYTVTFTYLNDRLHQKQVLRQSDLFSYSKTYNYDVNGTLTNIDYS